MRRVAALLALAALAACADTREPTGPADASGPSLAVQQITVQGAPEQVVPGRILVKLRSGTVAEDVAGPRGLSVTGRGYRDAFVMLRGAVGNERALAASLRGDARVIYAEPDYLRQPTVDPVIFSKLWGFHNPGGLTINFTRGPNRGSPVTSFISTADADEDAGGPDVPANYGAGGAPVVIGSIDTGVEFLHPEFAGVTLIAGQDWYSSDANPADEDGHGTHTTGTMAGINVGVAANAGAGPNISVYVQRVCGPQGCPTSAIVNAIRAAADFGVVAMNLSLGGGSLSQAEKDAIAYATDVKGALVIASAGNDGTGTVSCPACDPKAIAVGATEWQDKLTYYTNWGTGLDLTAPGGQLYSNTTEEAGIYSAYVGGGYRYLQGTSMAAPQVTGTAGVVASKTGARGAALRARLMGSGDDRGASGYDTSFGCGRLNTHRATTASALNGCEDPTAGGGSGGTLTAAFTYSCGGNATCNFDGSGSTGASTYSWTFGDGNSATGVTATNTYGSAGSYTVTLTVGNGTATNQTNKTVTCSVKGPKLRCS